MKLSLMVMTPGKQAGQLLHISLAQFLIGRDPQCQLRPSSAMISKRHCALIQRDEKAFLRDFDSTNGTFLNDEKVVGEVELKKDDRIKVGPLDFKVVIEATAPLTERPTPAPASIKQQKSGIVKPAAAAKAPEKAAEKATVGAGKGDSADEDVVAMLLSMGDDSTSGMGGSVPDGTTVHDMRASPEMLAAGASADDTKENVKADAKEKAKIAEGSTINAAKAILEKMMRRPR